METRTYYLPRNRFSIMVINKIYEKIGCSIGDIKVSAKYDYIRVPITCEKSNVIKIEKILYRYNMIGE